MQQRIADYYDQVLVYGERAVFDPVAAYAFPRSLAQRTRFCGYVLNRESERSLENFEWPFPHRERRTRPVVLATMGGGEDGFRVSEAFIHASADAPWHAVDDPESWIADKSTIFVEHVEPRKKSKPKE